MVLTAGWIHAHKTKAGGWNAKQLAAIGVTWPPEKGWIGRAVGREITDDQKRVFVAHSAQGESRTAEE